MTSAESTAAEQEQLELLRQIHDQGRQQTALLRQIVQHTNVLYWFALISLIVGGMGVVLWVGTAAGL